MDRVTDLPDLIAASDVVAARRGRTYPMLAVKQALSDLSVEEAYRHYQDLLGSMGGDGIRRKRIESLAEAARSKAGHYGQHRPAGKPFVNQPPKVVGDGDHRTLECEERSLYVVMFPGVRVRGRSAFVEMDDAMLLDYEGGERARITDVLMLDPAVFRESDASAWIIEPAVDPAPLEVEEAFNLMGPNTFAFGHWLGEYLPKYLTAVRSGLLPVVPVLVDAGMPRQHRQALQAMLQPGATVIEVPPAHPVSVERLWCAPAISYCPVLPEFDERFHYDYISASPELFGLAVEQMRSAVLTPRPVPGADRVYLARKPSTHRKLVNHAEVEAVAEKQGFLVAYPEDMDFHEQVALVGAARYLMGPEGSAFFLGFFAPVGCRACVLNHQHTALLPGVTALLEETGIDCTVLTGPYVRKDPEYPHFSDYRIDVSQLRHFMDDWTRAPA